MTTRTRERRSRHDRRRSAKRARRLRLIGLGIALGLFAGLVYGIRWPMHLHRHWHITETIPLSRPNSLALDDDGALRYVTQATIPGALVRLTDTRPKLVFGDFGEPDGLLVEDRILTVSEAEDDGRVMAYNRDTARLRVLARMQRPEGLLRRPDGSLVVAQNVPEGRLWVLRDDAEPAVLVEGLNKPESLCNLPDGRIGIAESGRGRIVAYGPQGLEVLADDLDNIDRLACPADGSLWAVISRVRSGRLVHIVDGRHRTIARHLRQPQGIVLLPDGSLYLAESRANRVLRLAPRD
ncbi:hypothetical protein [Immundisolibacter sp.]|uniref:hypothetical protein n=1 Tax=Immundisolibacter sp. TaxID=1934948 RepID=UPI003569ABE7